MTPMNFPCFRVERAEFEFLVRVPARTAFWIAAFLSVFSIAGLHGQTLQHVESIPLPDLQEGDFDHFAIDLRGHRLFLAAEANGAVEVFDTRTNKRIHAIRGLSSPHAMVYRDDLKRLLVVDGDDSAVKIFDSEKYQLLGKIPVSMDADSMAYEPGSQLMYVVNGGREAHTSYSLISVIDTNAGKKLRDIRIEDTNWVEALALDPSGKRMFVNLTGLGEIGILDRETFAMVDRWRLAAEKRLNVPLKLDEPDHRLFVATRKPAAFLVLDSDSGKVVASMPCVDMVDDIAYDQQAKRIYLAGDGSVDIVKQSDPDHYARAASIPGSFRAKTAILVPELHRYYLAVPRHGDHVAEVRVYQTAN